MDQRAPGATKPLSVCKGSSASLDSDVRSDTRREHDKRQRKVKARLVELLFAAGFAQAAKRVARCSSSYIALACHNRHRVQSIPSFRCRHRLCPYCAVERQRRVFLKFGSVLKNCAAKENARVVLITLTIETTSDPLLIQDKCFKAALRRLRRMKRWKDRISGALCGYEFTLTPKGWHYHAHILAFRRAWYEQEQLAEDWQRAMRTSKAIVDIRAISNLSDGLRSTLQYCFKPTQIDAWTTSEIQQFEEMKRVKLSECFGSLRGLRVVEGFSEEREASHALFVGCPCPACGEPLRRIKISWRDLDGLTAIPAEWYLKPRAGPCALS
jgi:plasmid rolling circle replication initiator protein Rep